MQNYSQNDNQNGMSAIPSNFKDESVYAREFQERGCVLVKNFCGIEAAHLLAESLRMSRDVQQHKTGKYFRDVLVPNAFAEYAHFDFALLYWADRIARLMGMTELVPVTSYTRIYEKNAVLIRHEDRPLLELSATICLKRDTIPWKFGVKDLHGKETLIEQNDGDALLYRGSLTHWREGPFLGDYHTQVFLHYCDPSSPLANTGRFDGRARLGILPTPPLNWRQRTRRKFSRLVSWGS